MASSTPSFREIGAGSCGIVYTDGPNAIKRARAPDQAINLENDYHMHLKIVKALHKPGSDIDILVPKPHSFAVDGDEWWQEHEKNFPHEERNLPQSVLLSERILPLPSELREALVEKFCPEKQKGAALEKPRNEDCLVRVCLGEIEAPRSNSVLRKNGQLLTDFSLRNFPLTLTKFPQTRDLHDPFSDPAALARSMAQTLAVLHWEAHVNARDVEFVLGSARSSEPASTGAPCTRLWLLDFNQVKDITLDEQGVVAAKWGFLDNDRYYPRPFSGDEKMDALWKVFKEAYLAKSEKLSQPELSRMFVQKIEEHERSKVLDQSELLPNDRSATDGDDSLSQGIESLKI